MFRFFRSLCCPNLPKTVLPYADAQLFTEVCKVLVKILNNLFRTDFQFYTFDGSLKIWFYKEGHASVYQSLLQFSGLSFENQDAPFFADINQFQVNSLKDFISALVNYTAKIAFSKYEIIKLKENFEIFSYLKIIPSPFILREKPGLWPKQAKAVIYLLGVKGWRWSHEDGTVKWDFIYLPDTDPPIFLRRIWQDGTEKFGPAGFRSLENLSYDGRQYFRQEIMAAEGLGKLVKPLGEAVRFNLDSLEIRDWEKFVRHMRTHFAARECITEYESISINSALDDLEMIPPKKEVSTLLEQETDIPNTVAGLVYNYAYR